MSSPVTNPTPEEVLDAFRELGLNPIPLWLIPSVHIRVLVARGIYLAANILVPGDEEEFLAIEQELANRVMGRVPLLK
jgi:hypothetical protein